jgi:hypothetical protein
MATENESADRRLELLAQAFETLALCAKELTSARVKFEPSALDMALNFIGVRFFFSTPERKEWQEEQYRHWIQDAPIACQKLIEMSRGRTITRHDVALMFKAPPPR